VKVELSERKRAIAAGVAFEIAPSEEMQFVIRYLEAPGCLYSWEWETLGGGHCGDGTRASVFNYERRYCRLALKRPKGRPYQLSIFKPCAEVRRVAHIRGLDPEEVRLTLLGRHFLKLGGKGLSDDRV